jgi:hypothetical protein
MQQVFHSFCLAIAAEREREAFVKTLPRTVTTLHFHQVNRKNIYSSVQKLFEGDGVEDQFPLRISFTGERGFDLGGVYRDMLSAFWKAAYVKMFDGGGLLTPVLHPQVDLRTLQVLGKVLSHGYISSGCLPIRIAFPTLVAILPLQSGEVSDSLLVNTLLQTVSAVEATALKKALQAFSEFSADQQAQLMSILSRFGSRQLPSARGLRQQIIQVARFEFLVKPSAALNAISAGIPNSHRRFWNLMSVHAFYSIYQSLSATPAKVLDLITEPDIENSNQERVFGYLKQYVGDMKPEEIRHFLRFVTGFPVCPSSGIRITFNTLSGMGRQPRGHTCSGVLSLSTTYVTYEEFTREFQAILFSEEDAWRLDGV